MPKKRSLTEDPGNCSKKLATANINLDSLETSADRPVNIDEKCVVDASKIQSIDKSSWFEDNNNTINGSEFQNVAASCDELKSSFDFESDTVENASLAGPAASSSMYSDKSKILKEKYNPLFNLRGFHVVFDLQKKNVIKLNRTFELLRTIQKTQNINICEPCSAMELMDKEFVIVSSNIPKLLFVDIINYLREKDGCLFDSRNLFVDPQKLKNEQIWDDFRNTCLQNQKLNIFIDCTNGISTDVEQIFIYMEHNLIFVVSNDSQSEKLRKIAEKRKMEIPTVIKRIYRWTDLTAESQNFLINTKINFQNNSQISLMDLIRSEKATGNKTYEFVKIINDQLLNMFLENQQISINTRLGNELGGNYFELNYQPRSIKCQEFKNQKGDNRIVSENELISQVKDQKFVLFSDKPGSGKSWSMKNFAKILREENPTSWVAYVNLKQFIQDFEVQKCGPEFSTFMVENILKLDHKFEGKIFQKMYKSGKVFIIFDGFDEIAPNCAEFVSRLAQNFQQNGGNQLWIATRDYFEVDLKEKLKLDVAYSLQDMTADEGVINIARSWLLMDLKIDQNEPKSKEDFDECIKMSPNFQNYQQKARKIVKKALTNTNDSVSLPQLFKIISNGFKNEENIDDLQRSKIYNKFIKVLYKRWSKQKGSIRNEASIDSQDFEMNFYRFHQFHAILSLFPELAAILFPGYDGSEWPAEEIIACGILTIKNKKIYFIHETFREYFVADFIAKFLRKSKIDEKIVELFFEVLTGEKFVVIQMFLNDFVQSNVPNLRKYVQKISKMDNLVDYFIHNKENLIKIIMDALESPELRKELLSKTFLKAAESVMDSNSFLKLQNLVFDCLNTEELKILIERHEILQRIMYSNLKTDIFSCLLLRIKEHLGHEFALDILKMESQNHEGTILYLMCYNQNTEYLKIFMSILKNHFKSTEIFELICSCNKYGENILNVCVQTGNIKVLLLIWDNVDQHLKYITQINKYSNNILHHTVCYSSDTIFMFLLENMKTLTSNNEARKILKELGDLDQNLLQLAAKHNNSIELHTILWTILEENIQDSMPNFIIHVNEAGENLLIIAVKKNSKNIVEFIWQQIKRFLNPVEQKEYLTSNRQALNEASTDNEEITVWVGNLLESYEIDQSDSELLEIISSLDDDNNIESYNESSIENFPCLINAVIDNDYLKVKSLIKDGTDVSLEDRNRFSAIDYAWLNYINRDQTTKELTENEKIIMNLLKNNSKFPIRRADFADARESEEIQDIINLADEINVKILQHPNLSYFHDNNNEPVLLYALREQRNVVLSKISSQRSANYFKLLPIHILRLLFKSKIVKDNRNIKRWSQVEACFIYINQIENCSIILKVASTFDCLKINFDFNREYSCQINDQDHTNGVINIGAKDLLDYKKKYSVYQAVIQGICKFTLHVTFEDDFESNVYEKWKQGEILEDLYYGILRRRDEQHNQAEDELDGNVKCRRHAELIAILMEKEMIQGKAYFEAFKRKKEAIVVDNPLPNYIHRTFTNNNEELPNIQRTEDDILNEIKQKKIFVLSDITGTGKSSTFDYFGSQIRHIIDALVFYVKSGCLRDIISENIDTFQTASVQNILIEVFKIYEKQELDAFKKQYNAGNIVFICDGLDLTCPAFSHIIINFLSDLKKTTENCILISTRSHYAKEIEKKLNVNTYKFVPFTKIEITELIRNNLSDLNNIENVEKIISLMEEQAIDPIDNPLIIKQITKMCELNEAQFGENGLNFYNIFDKIDQELTSEINLEIPSEDKVMKTLLSSDRMHQIHAITAVLNNKYNPQLVGELDFMKIWEFDKGKWSVDKIQRFGILSQNFKNESMDFICRLFGIFFFAKYLNSFIYEDNDNLTEEYERVFEIMRFIGRSTEFNTVHKFLKDFKILNANISIGNIFGAIVTKNLSKILDDLKISTDCFQTILFWLNFLPSECKDVVLKLYDELLNNTA